MTNFNCLFCGDKMIVPPEVRKVASPVTNLFWHEECIDNPKYKLTYEKKLFWLKIGTSF